MKLTGADITESRVTFNSHLNHNTDCDILELVISHDAFITYCLNIRTNAECMEYYSGSNYVENSTIKSQSRMYVKGAIPKKYRTVWNALKEHYTKHFKS